MRWLYAVPSSATGWHRLATAYRRCLRTDVGTYLATRRRGFEQRSEGGSKPLHEVAGQSVERRIAGVKRGTESPFCREELGVQAQPLRECRPWRVLCGQDGSRVGAGIHLALKSRPSPGASAAESADTAFRLRRRPDRRSPSRGRPRLTCQRRPSPPREASRCCVSHRRAADAATVLVDSVPALPFLSASSGAGSSATTLLRLFSRNVIPV